MTKTFVELVRLLIDEEPADMCAWAMFLIIDVDYDNSELCQYLFNAPLRV